MSMFSVINILFWSWKWWKLPLGTTSFLARFWFPSKMFKSMVPIKVGKTAFGSSSGKQLCDTPRRVAIVDYGP